METPSLVLCGTRCFQPVPKDRGAEQGVQLGLGDGGSRLRTTFHGIG